jgi:hypothetical protein
MPLSSFSSRCLSAVRVSCKQGPGLGGSNTQFGSKTDRKFSRLSGLVRPIHQIESSDYFLNASRITLGEQHGHLVDRSCNYRALQRVHHVAVALWIADAVSQGLFIRVLPIVVCLSISPLPGSLCMCSGWINADATLFERS